MITSIRNIKRNFFQVFLGAGTGDTFLRDYVSIVDEEGVELHQIPLRYYHLSSGDLVEAKYETYPVISVQDFLPKPVEGWNNWPQKRFAGARDTDNDDVVDTATEYPKAIRLDYRFEVSVACKTEGMFVDIVDWFYRTFDFSNLAVLWFNKSEAGDFEYGDPVNYKITDISDNPRSDGIFENVYVFELSLWADIKPSVDHTTLVKEITTQFNYNQDVLPPTVTEFEYPAGDIVLQTSNAYPIGVSIND